MLVAPGQVDVVGVGAGAEELSVAIGEVLVAPAELGELGRADEREVHGPEEDDLPLARMALVAELGELLAALAAHDGLKVERWEAITDGQHASLLGFLGVAPRLPRKPGWSPGEESSNTSFLSI